MEAARFQSAKFEVPHVFLDLSTIFAGGDRTNITGMFTTSALVGEDVEIPTIDEVFGDPQPATYVPHRNMILLSLAASFAEMIGADRVFYGAQERDLYGYWDCTPEFVDKLNVVLRLNRGNPVNVEAPFLRLTKAKVVALGTSLGVDFDHTWSCYKGGEKACGVCPTCAERLIAFNENSLVDPLEYEIGIENIM